MVLIDSPAGNAVSRNNGMTCSVPVRFYFSSTNPLIIDQCFIRLNVCPLVCLSLSGSEQFLISILLMPAPAPLQDVSFIAQPATFVQLPLIHQQLLNVNIPTRTTDKRFFSNDPAQPLRKIS